MSRRTARENAFKIIFNCALLKEPPQDLWTYLEETKGEELWAEGGIDESDIEYMKAVVFGASVNKNEINRKIAPLLKNWGVDRLPKISLAILQLAIYEIDNCDDVPDKVAVNEAVELAKSYGDDDSYKFINGVLAKYLQQSRKNEEHDGTEENSDSNTD